MAQKPFFIITIDAEGDNLWSSPRKPTTRNAQHLPRFQSLCERYGLKSTYLASIEMVNDPAFREFARDALKRGKAEIGMHAHAWNTPPEFALTEDDARSRPYMTEYPEDVMRRKIDTITSALEDTFGVKMISHRAGRWGFNEVYANMLIEKGYKVDCSVTPHISWENDIGDPSKKGGTDYTRFPENAYFIDPSDISREGGSDLLEVPVTVIMSENRLAHLAKKICPNIRAAKKAVKRMMPDVHWMRPNGRNLKDLLCLAEKAAQEKGEYAEFMLHSSELMAGASPAFPSDKNIETLYEHLEILFERARRDFDGATLKEFYGYKKGLKR